VRIRFPRFQAGCFVLLAAAAATSVAATVAASAAGAEDTPQYRTPYRIDAWTTENGLPQNSVTSLLQTQDGYLWLGTFSGLVRFDGVRFTLADEGTPGAFTSNRILSLFEDRPGSLWIGSAWGGLTRLERGTFKTYTVKDGLPTDSIYFVSADKRGRVWLSTREGLVRLEGGRFTTSTVKDGLPGHPTTRVIEDRHGDLWFGTGAGLVRRQESGRATTYTTYTTYTRRDGLPHEFIQAIEEARDGSLWVATDAGVARLVRGRVTATYTTAEGLPTRRATRLLQDRAGNLWIGTENGIGVVSAESGDDVESVKRPLVVLTKEDGLSDGHIVALLEDREGDIWAGTRVGGVNRIKRRAMTAYGREQGLPGDAVVPITQDAAGDIWIGMTCGGLVRLRGATMTTYGTKDGLPNDCVWSLLPARDGSLWVGTWGGGLSRLAHGRFTTYTSSNSGLSNAAVLALHEDRAGTLWIGTLAGLNRFKDGAFTVYRARDGLVADDVRFIYEDRSGALWLAGSRGVSRMKDGHFTTYTTAEGLSHNFVRAVHETADGTIWMGTYGGGLNRLKDGRFTYYTTRHGLFENIVSRILEDDRGDFWMTGNKGIFRVKRTELDELAAGRTGAIASIAYGIRDGMISSECNGGGQPAGWRSRDGRLWFPTARGVVTIDPRSMAFNATPPPVVIEEVSVNRVNRTWQDASGEVDVPPGRGDLDIHYTALSFSAPEYVRFKYKLAGLDSEWTDAGTRRTASYSHLPPGRYTFTVTAANRDGVWNTDRPATVRLRIIPPFYRTVWFEVLAAALLGGLVLVVYEQRLRRLRHAHAARESFARQLIDSQESERKRISAELHDSLGQHLLIIKNRALLGGEAANGDGNARHQFHEIATSASAGIEEVRHIAYDLRPLHLDRLGLTSAIEVMVERVGHATGTVFDADIHDLDGLLSPQAEINLYRILQESVNNITKHARATRARITIRRERRQLRVTIDDNGEGFSPDAQRSPSSSSGAAAPRRGLGLTGIAERVRMLGGTHAVRSAPGQGTTLTIRLPLSSASAATEEGRGHDA
jgi:ligand-binding sensor domain-containing protein/signal transduction histidine kinase